MATAYYFVLPYAETDEGTQLLLAERQYIQRIIDGQTFDRTRPPGKWGPWPRIPDWAGQDVLVGGTGGLEDPAEETAKRLFREQTGVDLGDGHAGEYGLEAPARLRQFEDKDYNSFTVLFLKLTGQGLRALCADAMRNIDNRAVFDGVLRKVDVVDGPFALQKIGPIKPPANGWRNFLVQNYFGGQQPGGFNSTIDILQMRISKRSAQDASWFATAIKAVPEVPVVAELKRLSVETTGGGAASRETTRLGEEPLIVDATYAPGAFVRIRAITEPNTPAAHKLIQWEGGVVDERNPYDCRLVPLDQITPRGEPVTVTATLGVTLAAKVTIRPELADVSVEHAEDIGHDTWYATFAEHGAPVVIKVKLRPDTAQAYSHLRWNGGQKDPRHPDDRRLVPRDHVTPLEDPVVVEWKLNPIGRVAVIVGPSDVALAVANATNVRANEWVANYNAANVNPITITATTTPNTVAARSHIVWTHGTPGANNGERLVPVDQINAFGSFTDVTARLPNGRSSTVRTRVLPRITALTVVAYGFQIAGANWYTYVAAAPRTVVSVTTAPAGAAALAYVQWANTAGAGRAANERTVSRNAAGNVQITASIADGDSEQIDLDVRTPQPINELTLDVQDITFAGGYAVRSDANVAQGRQWVRGGVNPAQTYVRNSAVQVQATLDVTHAPAADTHIDVRATAFFLQANGGSSNMAWQQDNIAVDAVGMPQLAFPQTAGSVNLPNEVNYQDTDAAGVNQPLNVIWEMRSHGGPGAWTQFAVTNHPFYVTLGAPHGGVRQYWTELKICCLAANGENTAAGVVTAIYQPFEAKLPNGTNNAMTRTSGGPLRYWYNNRVPHPPAPRQTNSGMLADVNGNGSCRAWAMMLIDMYRLHGIGTGTMVLVTADTAINPASAAATGFMVQDWQFNNPPAPSGDGWSHTWSGNAQWVSGSAQNDQTPPVAFGNHFIVRDTTTNMYYDPSYGSPARATHQHWEDHAIAGLVRGGALPDLGFIKGAPHAPATITDLNNSPFPAY